MLWRMMIECKELYCKFARLVTKEEYVVDITGTILHPSENGEKCKGNGLHKDLFGRTIECCCDECSYFLACYKADCDFRK